MRKKGCAALAVLCLLAAFACKQATVTPSADIIARVGEHALLRSEVIEMMPKGAVEDSLIIMESITKKWIKDVLMYQIAQQNIGDDKAETDKLVEDYRRSLMRYRYQERLVREKLEVSIHENEKRLYYQNNQKEFVLDRYLVQGLFLKIPKNAPGLEDIRTEFHRMPEEAVEKIEKYSVQNAVTYDYFYDRWVDFEEIIHNIPVHIPNTRNFLERYRPLEENDDNYCYLLHIRNFLTPGAVAPYEYVSGYIVEILVNQRKMQFLRKFEDDLYNDAIRRRRAVVYE